MSFLRNLIWICLIALLFVIWFVMHSAEGF